MAGVLHRALLIAEVYVGEAVSLAVSVCPLEVIQQTPRVERADIRAIRNRARQLGQLFTEERDTPRVGHSAIFIFVRRVEIAAAALRDLDDRAVVLARDSHHEVVDAPRPDFETGICERAFGGHHSLKERVAVTAGSFVIFEFRAEAGWSTGLSTAY